MTFSRKINSQQVIHTDMGESAPSYQVDKNWARDDKLGKNTCRKLLFAKKTLTWSMTWS